MTTSISNIATLKTDLDRVLEIAKQNDRRSVQNGRTIMLYVWVRDRFLDQANSLVAAILNALPKSIEDKVAQDEIRHKFA